jgi:hypothetical protein
MREFDPIDRNPELMRSDPPVMKERESGLTTMGILAALAVDVGAGMYFFSTADNNHRVAMNTPSVTTGQSTMTPAPPDAGKTNSN